jgi:hypothetical protein
VYKSITITLKSGSRITSTAYPDADSMVDSMKLDRSEIKSMNSVARPVVQVPKAADRTRLIEANALRRYVDKRIDQLNLKNARSYVLEHCAINLRDLLTEADRIERGES